MGAPAVLRPLSFSGCAGLGLHPLYSSAASSEDEVPSQIPMRSQPGVHLAIHDELNGVMGK
ncbi:hypothetical protein GCM10010191_59030 [Actinomadura vinacea]|uniref:Uncharacterized protein n=1 Tax=Actinomadura vinacea TaxID=115336 RepID=A0ABN3JPG6_9ACTN